MSRLRYIGLALIAVAIASLTSCSDDAGNNAVYLPGAGAINKANFYITDEPDVRTFTVKITPESYPDLNPVTAGADATIYLAADPEKAETYNLLHGTDYPVLPEGSYKVSESVMMRAGESESEPATITVNAKDKIEPFVEYILPVSITGADGIACDDCCQTLYFLYRGSMDASNMELLDRSSWRVLAASSEEPHEGDWGHSGLKEACIDGDLNTFWGTDWATSHPQPPHWIVIDLGASTHIQGVAIQAREEGYDGAKTMTLEVCDDNAVWSDTGAEWNSAAWQTAGDFKDIPAAGQYRSFLPSATDGRYIRLTITSVNGGPHVTVSELNLF